MENTTAQQTNLQSNEQLTKEAETIQQPTKENEPEKQTIETVKTNEPSVEKHEKDEQSIKKNNSEKQTIAKNIQKQQFAESTEKEQQTVINGYVNDVLERKGPNGKFKVINLRIPYMVYNITTKMRETGWVEVNAYEQPELNELINKLSHNDFISATGKWCFFNFGINNYHSLRLGFKATQLQLVKTASEIQMMKKQKNREQANPAKSKNEQCLVLEK